MAKKEKMLTAIFHDQRATERAFDWLQTRGYDASEINVLMSDRTRAGFKGTARDDQIKSGSKASEGIATGGAIGTAVGATVAAIAAIGTSIAIPGLGLIVAGPVLAALAGGGAGAVAGGGGRGTGGPGHS